MNQLTKEQLKEFIARQLSGSILPEEKEQLEEWLDSNAEDRQWYERFVKERAFELLKVANEIQPEKSKARLLKIVHRRPVYYVLTRAVVAASIIGLICWQTYRFYNNEKEQISRSQSIVKANTISPGTYKATLTLEDGSTVTLDSASHQIINSTAGSDIVKAGSQLQYSGIRPLRASEILYNSVKTPVGGTYEVILSDGTHVWLNALSSIKFPRSFDEGERRVEVTGEVFMEVAKDASRPFKVTVRGMEVSVLGTRFNIMAYEEEPTIQTTLVEGKITVTQGDKTLALRPNDQARLTASGNLSLVPDADVQTALSWRFNKFRFNSTSVETIMRQIARWYDVEVKFKDPTARAIEFNGGISRFSQVKDVLERMERTNEVHFNINNRTIEVSR